MHDRRSFEPFSEEDEAGWSEPYRLGLDELPRTRAGASDVVWPCPECQSLRIEIRNHGRRIGGAIGTAAGATSAFVMALSGGEAGAVVDLIAGSIGSACGAIIAGLVGGAAGCATGVVFGEVLDSNVLDNYRCRTCGHAFSNRLTRFSIRPDWPKRSTHSPSQICLALARLYASLSGVSECTSFDHGLCRRNTVAWSR